MPEYIGFSTINANKPKTVNAPIGYQGGTGTVTETIIPGKKFRLVDNQLVIQDFLNALNIRRGTKVGQPQYGTDLWNFVFQPNIPEVQQALQEEITRIAAADPRIQLNYVSVYPRENGILLEVEMAIVPFNQASLLSVFFNSSTNTASLA
jgi:phage baseplate assembly protein W